MKKILFITISLLSFCQVGYSLHTPFQMNYNLSPSDNEKITHSCLLEYKFPIAYSTAEIEPEEYLATFATSTETESLLTLSMLKDQASYENNNLDLGESLVINDMGNPSSDDNYIFTRTYIKENESQYIADIAYYDGLGSLSHHIGIQASPEKKNIISPVYYDNMYRDNARVYLPYVSTNTTAEKETSPLSDQHQYYANLYQTEVTYAENIFDGSPLNRIVESFQVGDVFRQIGNKKCSAYKYEGNIINEVLFLYLSTSNDTLYVSGYYNPNTLNKNSITNEDGMAVVSFTDLMGRTVLQRVVGENKNHDTHYVYDDFGRLACVISPEGSVRLDATSSYCLANEKFISWYCYVYKYDSRGRVIEKKLPGKDLEYYVYDKGDRLVMSQDGNQRINNEWSYFVYDNLNRLIEQSIVICNTLSKEQIQDAYSSLDNSYPYLGGTYNVLKPFSGNKTIAKEHVMSIRYGNYNYLNLNDGYNNSIPFTIPYYLWFTPVSDIVKTSDNDTRVKGLKTYEKIAVLNSSLNSEDYVERAFYYDYKGRVIQTVEKSHLGVARYSMKYDFVGNILACKEEHIQLSNASDDYELLVKGAYFVIYPEVNIETGLSWEIDPTNKYILSETEVDKVKPKYYITSRNGKDYYYIPPDCLQIAYELAVTDPMQLYQVIDYFPGQGEPLTHLGNISMSQDSKLSEFTYDHRGRLLSETTTLNGGMPAIVEYGYDELGRLKNNWYGSKIFDVKVNPDFIVHLFTERHLPSDRMNALFSEILKRDYGIDNWEDYEYFKDGDINQAYRLNHTVYAWPYYFPYFENFNTVSEITSVFTEAAKRILGSTHFIRSLGVGIDSEKRPNEKFSRDLTFRLKRESGIPETYAYNIQGWLTEKTSQVFDMQLKYFDPAPTWFNPVPPSYTGNITEWNWQHKGTDVVNNNDAAGVLTFIYDKLNRLSEAFPYTYNGNGFHGTALYYDLNGNITELVRAYEGELVDDLFMTYEGNQLTQIYDNGYCPPSFPNIYESSPYTPQMFYYDANGNIEEEYIYMYYKDHCVYKYNFLNLLEEYRHVGGTLFTKYSYLADGTKVSAQRGDGTFGIEYKGSLVYKRNAAGKLTLESTSFAGGRIVASETTSGMVYTPLYYITDHLGSTRVIVDANGDVKERNEYYPFGPKLPRSDFSQSDNRYTFTGKEDQEQLGLSMIDFGARMYDPLIGRWKAIDPMAEKYPSISPYAYCANNPIRYLDPDGRDWYEAIDGTKQYDPYINEKSKLQNGETYLGATYQERGADYRGDGSIMYSKESDAYSRIVSQSERTGNESMVVLTDGGTLVLPDYKNTSTSVDIRDYGYSTKNGNIVDATGTTHNTIATAHTHPSGNEASTPDVMRLNDVGFATGATPGKPVYVLRLNGVNKIDFVIAAPTPSGLRKDVKWNRYTIPDASVNHLIKGSFSLRQYTEQNKSAFNAYKNLK